HDKIFLWRDDQFTVLLVTPHFRHPGPRGAGQRLSIRGREVVARPKFTRVVGLMTDVGFIQGSPVHKHLSMENLDPVSGEPDDPFDKVLTRFRLIIRRGEFEYHHITTAQGSIRKDVCDASTLGSKNEFIDK